MVDFIRRPRNGKRDDKQRHVARPQANHPSVQKRIKSSDQLELGI